MDNFTVKFKKHRWGISEMTLYQGSPSLCLFFHQPVVQLTSFVFFQNYQIHSIMCLIPSWFFSVTSKGLGSGSAKKKKKSFSTRLLCIFYQVHNGASVAPVPASPITHTLADNITLKSHQCPPGELQEGFLARQAAVLIRDHLHKQHLLTSLPIFSSKYTDVLPQVTVTERV